jgi:hypothetical protein
MLAAISEGSASDVQRPKLSDGEAGTWDCQPKRNRAVRWSSRLGHIVSSASVSSEEIIHHHDTEPVNASCVEQCDDESDKPEDVACREF